MDSMTKANLVREGSKIASDLLRLALARPRKGTGSTVVAKEPPSEEKTTITTPPKGEVARPIRAKSTTVGCRGCTSKHFGICSGVLGEAVRFARDEGIKSENVEKSLAICEEQLATWEAGDASPESYADLPDEKKIWLREWLPKAKGLTYQVRAVKTIDDLEKSAAYASQLHQKAWKELRELGEIEESSPFLDEVQRQAERVKIGELTKVEAVKELEEWQKSAKA